AASQEHNASAASQASKDSQAHKESEANKESNDNNDKDTSEGSDENKDTNADGSQDVDDNKDNGSSTGSDTDTSKDSDQSDTDTNTDTDTDTEENQSTDEAVWTETAQSGVVTVGGSLASLQNDNNEITTRSLAANTAWQTDKFRTNSKTGQVQYRVSTHEWVNASNVSFAKNGVVSALSNITNLSGSHSVNLAGPTGFVYALFSANGSRSSRGLAGNSAWFTDKSATDAQGNTYYCVSTDEWVKFSNGVSFN
ncbi:hypothetical protein, partial [Companilactobacillus versmoldensis]|uniref:hypothetical protein n=1 Tax=Companilactobacillus versmoldensis TaxID=194326 RepID=UPI000B263777